MTGSMYSTISREQYNKAIEGLLYRICGEYAVNFRWEWLEPEKGRDVWQLGYRENYVILRGNTPVSIAVALHHYLKEELHIHFSWCGKRVQFPSEFPRPRDTQLHVILQEHRMFLNYCTMNYTAAWWDWDRWEEEIDFMALNGINHPLAVIGQEGIWYETLLQFGFTDKEARDFLTGPAYFAWQWMTNIQSFAGPVSREYIKRRVSLGQRMIARYRELGMTPVQQGFSGFLPLEAIDRFPQARIIKKPGWCGFPETAQLDPTDPLFITFGREFMNCQQRLFGAFHYYGVDPFHEGEPPCDTPEYLHSVGEQICRVLQEYDPDYTWVMQAWSIRKDIALAAPRRHLLVLDLNGDTWRKKEGFWGYPFVLGELHNFGGRTNLHGDIRRLGEFSYESMSEQLPNLTGRGIFMEGMIQNPAYYDLLFSQITRQDAVKTDVWLMGYLNRRYGKATQKAVKAWEILLDTVYDRGTNEVESSSIICARPAINVKKSGPNRGFELTYSNQELLKAILLLWQEREIFGGSDGYRYDMVDMVRQLLSNYAQELHHKAMEAWLKKDQEAFGNSRKQFLGLLRDMDRFLGTREEFRFEKWVGDARRAACSQEEADLFEKNASMLLTIWGPEDNPEIFDYAWREWSGLIIQYYSMRWESFYDMLEMCLKKGQDYSEENLPLVYGREAFEANPFYSELARKEREWILKTGKSGFCEKQDELEETERILNSWLPALC